MVSKASDDLPDPLRPVMTTSLSRGRSTSMFFKLCSRAPRTVIDLFMGCSYQEGRELGSGKPQTYGRWGTELRLFTRQTGPAAICPAPLGAAVAFRVAPAYRRDRTAE